MDTADRIGTHLTQVVERTALARAPFDHLVLHEPFPADLYAELLRELPEDRYYRELMHSDAILPDGRSARLQFPLVDDNIARLPAPQRDFWRAVTQGLAAATDAYKRKFAEALLAVTGKNAESIRLRPYCTLFRDRGGYKISIHPDSPRKAITTQFYLPSDESQLHLGTLFHARNDDGSFREEVAMRFAPNTGYAFAVTPASYHSVNPMRPNDRPRNSLMIIISYDRGPLVEGFKAARAKVRGLYDRMVGAKGERTEAGEGRYETM